VFGPSRGLTPASTCPWVDHSVSGLPPTTESPCSDSLSLRLRFLNLAVEEQLAGSLCKRHAVTDRSLLRPLVSTRFQVLFHSPRGVLFTFPSRYLFTIGRQGVLSLTGWSPWIPTGFPVPGRTQVLVQRGRAVSRTGLLPAVARLSIRFRYHTTL
jgi:hypothetical protein